mmetsp:Transcript_223/g.494  ORF Transcript_223/g.494 Transcript_223/m.494 type:complete len:138 (-) Transcript_223:306-719(-)
MIKPHPYRWAAPNLQSNRSGGGGSSGVSEEKLQRKKADVVLIFVKLLVKYLEKKDPGTYRRAKESVIRCVKEHKDGNPRYAIFVDAMARDLRSTVGESHWKWAQKYFQHLVRIKSPLLSMYMPRKRQEGKRDTRATE